MSPILESIGSVKGFGWGALLGGSFESIATTTLSTSAANIQFTSIPATYTHLQIRGIARTDYAGTPAGLNFRFNSDTASNYSYHGFYGNGSTITALNGTSASFGEAGQITGSTKAASIFGVCVLDILDYANTNKYKTTRSLGGWDSNGDGQSTFYSSNWRSTNAITTITLSAGAGNFIQYSQFALYGIKGA